MKVDMLLSPVEKFINECKVNDAIRDQGLTTPDDIRRFDNIKYGPHDDNLLDVYCRKTTDAPSPTIISVHGGYWVYGDKELYSHYCMRLAQRGFTVINFTYRLAPDNKYPAQVEDILQVLTWVCENGTGYFADVNNLFLVGDSIGAQMCVQVCEMLSNEEYAGLFSITFPKDVGIRACGLNCGLYRISVSEDDPPTDKHMLRYYLPDDYMSVQKQFDILNYINKDFPPSYITTAEYDMFKDEAEPLYRALQNSGVLSEIRIYGSPDQKEIGHVFHVNCGLDAAAECNDDECKFFRQFIV